MLKSLNNKIFLQNFKSFYFQEFEQPSNKKIFNHHQIKNVYNLYFRCFNSCCMDNQFKRHGTTILCIRRNDKVVSNKLFFIYFLFSFYLFIL